MSSFMSFVPVCLFFMISPSADAAPQQTLLVESSKTKMALMRRNVDKEPSHIDTVETPLELPRTPSKAGVGEKVGLSKAMSLMRVTASGVVVTQWYGRLGNNIIQVVNAIEVAEFEGVPVILPASGTFWEIFNKPSSGQFEVQQVPKKHCIVRNRTDNGYYFYYDAQEGECFTPDERHRVMQRYLKPLFRGAESEADSSELVIHLRGGDLFTTMPHHPQANQPPCAAYDRIIRDKGYTKVRIVTSADMLNPCEEEIKRKHGGTVIVQSKSVIEDFSTLMSAQNIFIGYSTFSWTAYLMSDKVTQAFRMQMQDDKLMQVFIGQRKGTTLTALLAPHQDEQNKGSVAERVAWMVNTPEDEITLAPPESY